MQENVENRRKCQICGELPNYSIVVYGLHYNRYQGLLYSHQKVCDRRHYCKKHFKNLDELDKQHTLSKK